MKENPKLVILFFGLIFTCAVVVVMVGVGRPKTYRVEGFSMLPTADDGDFLLITPLAQPERGDVIVFKYPQNPRKLFIKRVIGLPNEQVAVSDHRVFINGQLLAEGAAISPPNYEWRPVTAAANEYFVLGDNRNESSDSHAWGMLPAQNIVGKAWFTYWPPNKWGTIQ